MKKLLVLALLLGFGTMVGCGDSNPPKTSKPSAAMGSGSSTTTTTTTTSSGSSH
jgi:hypothetical protein